MTAVDRSGTDVNGGVPPELRTFLFADVRGYTRFTQEQGDQAAARLVGTFATVTREEVTARGGELTELRGDEALAVFGSARQAIRAAIALQARYALESERDGAFPLRVGIGIDAGEAVPSEGGYRGEALNLAARLCNLASPGEVLATEGVVYLGRRVQGITYVERGEVPLKGFSDPVRVIRIVQDSSAPLHSPKTSIPGEGVPHERSGAPVPIGGFLGALPSGVLISREQEWEHIVAALETVPEGTGRFLLLSGEPGIGKTRLAQEVTLKAQHWGFLVATGRCYEPEQAVPYYPFLEILVTLYESCSPSVRADVPRRWSQLGRLLPDLLGFLPATVEGQEDQYLLFRAVTGFIEAIAETQPLALLLDDLHWADDASLRLLQHLARYTRAARVFLLGTYRDVEIHRQHPLETMLLDLSREQLVEEVEVRRLDLEGTKALTTEILGEDEDLADLSDLVYRRTDGNAFFIGEMLHALVERGDLYREDGHWARPKIREMEVPKSIRSVIGQRLSRLEEQAQEILREASVLGQEFTFEDLFALGQQLPPLGSSRTSRAIADDRSSNTGWSEDDIEGALEQARLAGLVRETGEERYAFNHALTQQALYAEVSTRRRKRLHLAAGKSLERLSKRERERRAGELAWHYLEGDDVAAALHYAMLAGDEAAKVFANREADRQYRTALELARELEQVDKEVEALEKLANVLTIGARYDQALEMLEQAAQLHQEAADRNGEACVVAQLGHVHYLRETPEEGIARLQPLIDALEADSNTQASFGLASLWAALGRLYMDSGNYETELRAAERAAQLAQGLPQSPESTRLLLGAEVTRGDALWGLGQNEEALGVMERVIPRAEEVGDLNNLARALGSIGMFYARRGEFEKDRQYLERMLQVSERRGDRYQIVLGSMSLSTNAFHVGTWDQARRYLERAEATIRALGTTRLSTWPVAARGWLSLREGDLDAANEYAREGLSLAESSGESVWRRHALRLQAEIDLASGLPQAALGRLEPELQRGGWRDDAGFLRTLARVQLDLGNDGEAQDLAAQAMRLVRKEGNQPELVEALILQATVWGREQAWERSEGLFNEAISVARGIPFPFGEGRALYELGMVAAHQGDLHTARKHLKRSLTIFEKLGATRDAQGTQAALTTLGATTRKSVRASTRS